MDRLEVGGLDDRRFGVGEDQAHLLREDGPGVVVSAEPAGAAQDPQQGEHDSGLGPAIASNLATSQVDVVGEVTPRDRDPEGTGRVS